MGLRRCALVVAVVAILAAPLRGQVTETPIAFDSAGTVRSITPPLAARLALAPPSWPVSGDYVEARLFAVSIGGYVLVAERTDGRLDRFSLSSTDADALRVAVTNALTREGPVIREGTATRISESARGAFVRNQTLLAAVLYGPAAAALTHNGPGGTALYLAGVGGTYFAVAELATRTPITKAQNALATDGALRGTAMMFGVLRALNVELTGDLASVTILVGGVGGSTTGYALGRGLTDAEAKSMTSASTLAALTTLGVAGTLGLFSGHGSEQAAAAVALAGAIPGYALGPLYPRRAQYTVTNGDIQLIDLTALLCGMTATIPISQRVRVDRAASALITAGLLTGVWVGDRVFARPFDHTETEGRLVAVGAVAGGLIGSAVPVLAQTYDKTTILAAATIGGWLGTALAESLVRPRAAGSAAPAPARGDIRRLQLDWAGVTLAAAGRVGNHPIVRLSF